MKLYQHQKEILDKDPKRCGIFIGTGSGKTALALLLAKGRILVIAPKTQVLDGNWEREAKKIGVENLTVISKEQFKKDHKNIEAFDTVIADEAHTILGSTPNVRWRNRKPVPKCSQIYEACLWFVQNRPPERLYLLTATPTRNPMCVWAAAQLLGHKWNFYQFRDAFFFKLPMPGREVWQSKKDTHTKERLGKAVRTLGYTGRLSDWFDVPDQTHKVESVPMKRTQEAIIESLPVMFPDPLVLIGKTHQVENGILHDGESTQHFPTDKTEAILRYLWEFDKILVFMRYTGQIEALKRAAEKEGTPVWIMTGQTKNRGDIIAEAEKADRGIFIAQSQISSGWELPSFRCTIFASMSYSHVDWMQGLGRTLRANNLAKNLYVYLLSGEIDRAVYENVVINKADFQEKIYAKGKELPV